MRSSSVLWAAAFATWFSGVAGAQCDGAFFRGSATGAHGSTPLGVVDWDPDGPGIEHARAVAYGAFSTIEGDPVVSLAQRTADGWIPVGGAVNGSVRCAVTAGSQLVIAGSFTAIGDVAAPGVAMFDGVQWHSLGTEPANGEVRVLAEHNGHVMAFGEFTRIGGAEARYVAIWDGVSWRQAGSGWDSPVPVLVVHRWGEQLVIGTSGAAKAELASAGIIAWNGERWVGLGQGVLHRTMTPSISFLASSQDELIASGVFTSVDGQPAQGVVAWNGMSWRPLGIGRANSAQPIEVFRGEIYTAQGSTILRWDGASWVSTGSPVGGPLLVYRDRLLCVGYFQTPMRGLAAFDGVSWSEFDGGVRVGAGRVLSAGGDLFVMGPVPSAGGTIARGLCVRTGEGWREWGGVDGSVGGLLSDGSDLYISGAFSRVGGVGAANIAQWRDGEWRAMGPGLNGRVMGLARSEIGLVAVGTFSRSGDQNMNRVAAWDGTSWRNLGAGITNGTVRAAESWRGSVVIAGSFSRSGDVTVPNIAIWGDSWNALGGGLNGAVRGLLVWNDELYASGSFDVSGGGGIARWDGISWRSLGSGVHRADGTPASVDIAGTWGDAIIVRGDFRTAGGLDCFGEAMWNGVGWQTLGNAPSSDFSVTEFDGKRVFASRGNTFDLEGRPIPYTRLGELREGQWHVGDEQWDGNVSMVVHDGQLVLGGDFSRAAESIALGFARWSPDQAPRVDLQPSSQNFEIGSDVVLRTSVHSRPESVIEWYRDGELLNDGPTGSGSIVAGARSTTLVILTAQASDSGRYWAKAVNSCGEVRTAAAVIESCPADFNADGFLDFFDYADFVGCFEGVGCPGENPLAADFNRDGFLDFFDYAAFVEAFEGGC